MRNRQLLAIALASGLVLFTSGISVAAPEKQEPPACSLPVPSMSGLQMTAAPDGLDPALASFLGAWEGKWETGSFPPLPSRFVVHRIDASTGTAFYAWGADGANMQPGSSSMNLQVDGKTLRVGTDIKFGFTINDDGSAIEGVRETNRGLVSKVTMVRCTLPELTAAPPAPQQPSPGRSQPTDLAACTLNDKFVPTSGQTGKPFSELLAAPPASELQAKYLGAWQGTMNGETVRLVVFATDRLQYTWASMNPGEDANAYRSFQVDEAGVLNWSSGQNINYTATMQDDGTLKLHQTRSNGEADGVLNACRV